MPREMHGGTPICIHGQHRVGGDPRTGHREGGTQDKRPLSRSKAWGWRQGARRPGWAPRLGSQRGQTRGPRAPRALEGVKTRPPMAAVPG